MDLFCFAPPPLPSLVSLYFLRPTGARAIFLHSNVLYNYIYFVIEGRKKTGGPKHPKIFLDRDFFPGTENARGRQTHHQRNGQNPRNSRPIRSHS